MSKFSAADTLELPVSARLQLVEEIWETIAAAPEALPLTDEDKRLIDERLEARRRDPQAGSSWEEVFARITSRPKGATASSSGPKCTPPFAPSLKIRSITKCSTKTCGGF
jgi:putative addiction module component (TIGR02574 family)